MQQNKVKIKTSHAQKKENCSHQNQVTAFHPFSSPLLVLQSFTALFGFKIFTAHSMATLFFNKFTLPCAVYTI